MEYSLVSLVSISIWGWFSSYQIPKLSCDLTLKCAVTTEEASRSKPSLQGCTTLPLLSSPTTGHRAQNSGVQGGGGRGRVHPCDPVAISQKPLFLLETSQKPCIPPCGFSAGASSMLSSLSHNHPLNHSEYVCKSVADAALAIFDLKNLDTVQEMFQGSHKDCHFLSLFT